MERVKWFGAAVLMACACGGTPTAQTSALSASPTAQGFGVYGYAIKEGSVSILGKDGEETGVLRATVPSAETRLIEIDYTDGQTFTGEVTRPLDGRFLAPVDEDRDGAILADPALAPFFAGYALELRIPGGKLTKSLDASTYADCSDSITFPSGCVQAYCSDYTWWWDANGTTLWTRYTFYADCPPTSNPLAEGGGPYPCTSADLVGKYHACAEPGGCMNSAKGKVDCGCYSSDDCGGGGKCFQGTCQPCSDWGQAVNSTAAGCCPGLYAYYDWEEHTSFCY